MYLLNVASNLISNSEIPSSCAFRSESRLRVCHWHHIPRPECQSFSLRPHQLSRLIIVPNSFQAKTPYNGHSRRSCHISLRFLEVFVEGNGIHPIVCYLAFASSSQGEHSDIYYYTSTEWMSVIYSKPNSSRFAWIGGDQGWMKNWRLRPA